MAGQRLKDKGSKTTTGAGDEGPRDEAGTATRADALDTAIEKLVPKQAAPMGRGEAVLRLAKVNEAADKLEERHAEDRYLVGEELADMLAHGVHLVLGETGMGPFVKKHFHMGRSWAFESMRVAKRSTREDVKDQKWHVLEQGVELADLMGVWTLGELKKKPLPVGNADGSLAYFPTTPEHHDECIRYLERQKREKQGDDEEPTETQRRLLRRAGIVLQGCLERDPSLAPANPRVFLRGGEARFDIDSVALRSDALPALARAVAELLKALKTM